MRREHFAKILTKTETQLGQLSASVRPSSPFGSSYDVASICVLSPSPPPVGVALLLPAAFAKIRAAIVATNRHELKTHRHTHTQLEPISASGWLSEYN